jgi:hypothetical protein
MSFSSPRVFATISGAGAQFGISKSSHGGAQPGGRAAAGNIGDIEIPGTLHAETKEMNTRPGGREALSRRLAAGPSKNRRT